MILADSTKGRGYATALCLSDAVICTNCIVG